MSCCCHNLGTYTNPTRVNMVVLDELTGDLVWAKPVAWLQGTSKFGGTGYPVVLDDRVVVHGHHFEVSGGFDPEPTDIYLGSTVFDRQTGEILVDQEDILLPDLFPDVDLDPLFGTAAGQFFGTGGNEYGRSSAGGFFPYSNEVDGIPVAYRVKVNEDGVHSITHTVELRNPTKLDEGYDDSFSYVRGRRHVLMTGKGSMLIAHAGRDYDASGGGIGYTRDYITHRGYGDDGTWAITRTNILTTIGTTTTHFIIPSRHDDICTSYIPNNGGWIRELSHNIVTSTGALTTHNAELDIPGPLDYEYPGYVWHPGSSIANFWGMLFDPRKMEWLCGSFPSGLRDKRYEKGVLDNNPTQLFNQFESGVHMTGGTGISPGTVFGGHTDHPCTESYGDSLPAGKTYAHQVPLSGNRVLSLRFNVGGFGPVADGISCLEMLPQTKDYTTIWHRDYPHPRRGFGSQKNHQYKDGRVYICYGGSPLGSQVGTLGQAPDLYDFLEA